MGKKCNGTPSGACPENKVGTGVIKITDETWRCSKCRQNTVDQPHEPEKLHHNELLCYIANNVNGPLKNEVIMSICVDFYEVSEIEEAIDELSSVYIGNITDIPEHTTGTKAENCVMNIIYIMSSASDEQLPKFVAANLSCIPPSELEKMDVLSLYRDQSTIRNKLDHHIRNTNRDLGSVKTDVNILKTRVGNLANGENFQIPDTQHTDVNETEHSQSYQNHIDTDNTREPPVTQTTVTEEAEINNNDDCPPPPPITQKIPTSYANMLKREAQNKKDPHKPADKSEPPSTRIVNKVSHTSHNTIAGVVLALGQGDVGQLGLGEDILERSKPALVKIADPVVQVVAGGMHTVCLTDKGEVYTFGCNDEGALGRDTSEDGSETTPAKVNFSEKVVQISAGDSHTAALTDDGRVFIWGSFRDSTGVIGLMKAYAIVKEPMHILPDPTVIKISSGTDHLVMLTSEGQIYTAGNSEQGQLGRLAECFCVRGGRKGLESIIRPCMVRFKKLRGKPPVFVDIWAGSYDTFAKEESGQMYGWGLNNYYQLGTGSMDNLFVPLILQTFKGRDWKSVSSGQHHSMMLDSDGKIFVTGRADYGRLGLGNEGEKKIPTPLTTLNGTKCSFISCGSAVSLAVTNDGKCLSWGMGTNGQLGQVDEEDVNVPSKMLGKQLENKKVLQVSGGGQHVVLLAESKS